MSSIITAALVRPTKGTEGSPPAVTDTSAIVQKPSSNAKVQLPVQVAPEVRRSFKAYAAERDMSMSDLFVHMWDDYRAQNA